MFDVLLVEDHRDTAKMTRTMLEAEPSSFRVHWVARLGEARAILAQREFDVVLLDLQLPDGNGRELLCELQHRIPRLPVVILSGYDDRATVIELVQMGAADYIAKGSFSSTEAFQEHLRNVIRQREALRAVYDAVGAYGLHSLMA